MEILSRNHFKGSYMPTHYDKKPHHHRNVFLFVIHPLEIDHITVVAACQVIILCAW